MDLAATQLAFENPVWLAALALVPLGWFSVRRSLVHLPPGRQAASAAVRSLLVVLLVLGLAGPKLRRAGQGMFLVVAHDTSLSIGAEAAEQSETFRRELARHSGGADVAELPFPEDPERDPTDLAAALVAARAMVPADRVPRILLLTDGNATVGNALGAASVAGCEIDVVPLPAMEHEVYLSAIEAPAAIREGESFFADVLVQSLHQDAGRLTLRVDEEQSFEQEVQLAPGTNRFRFRSIAATGPWVRLSAHIDECRDTLAENNTAAALVFVQPRPRILLIDSQPELAGVLRAALESDGQFETEVHPPESLPAQLDRLLEYDLLILSNVPAADLSEPQVAAVDRYVHEHGGGLIVVGGNRAFTAGAYGGTPLETMLPVAVYDKPDKPKPSLAMVLVLDRSGSMQGAPIELARQAARQAIARLGPHDQVGILAFEDRMHWVVPLQTYSDEPYVMDRIATIIAGGGTNIYPALDQAYLALRDAEADLRHIILLSDGVSHPGDFDALVQRIAEDGITMSTVGVGDEASEEFLRNIAALASGQAYFCTDPAEMPRIFELDVMAVGKHGITEKPFQPDLLLPARMLGGFDPAGVPPLLGYVDTRAKPGSQLLLNSPAGDPVLAWWRYGRGVSMAFTSDVHQRWAAAWHRWPGFGNFWTSLARQAMRADPSQRFAAGIAHHLDRTELTLDVLDRDGRWLNAADVTLRVDRPNGRTGPLACELVEPGRYAAAVPRAVAGDLHAEFTVVIPDEATYTIRRGFSTPYPEQLRIRPTRTGLLRQVADQSRGRFEPSPADVFRPAETRVPRTIPLGPWLLAAALVLFVFDVAIKRGRLA